MSEWIKLYDAMMQAITGLAESVGFMSMTITLNAPKPEYEKIYEKHLESLENRQQKVIQLLHEWELEREDK